MEIKFADSFGDSLKTMIRHNTWWYMTYHDFLKTFGGLENLYGITIGLTTMGH
jgi:hypothetical protein